MTNVYESQTITVGPADISLWHVAAKYLGDATQANRIMDVNGLSETWVTGTIILQLPPYDSSQTGGLST
ncbi:hypothetical protein [Acetobacter estunensis]|uniref:hypothetical protein n=1 Tax=Acetobacter estunensis TaxID=104097 RepID=UPI001C2DDDB6|nr:hypothetical protein [Acetobacter estunensis]MBV1838032.1 hypothetical protein [Acetobacter estunensis]